MKRKPRKKVEEPQASTRPFWSGTITFGLVSIPVDLFPATRHTRVGLRMLDAEGEPLHRRYFSQKTDRELDDSDLISGYEIEKNKFVEVTDEELEKLAPEKSRDINLERFVDEASIPPLYFESAYFLAPSGASAKSYRLLAAVMQKTKQAGIATFVMRGKEYLVSIFSETGVLRASTMRFAKEVRSPQAVGLPQFQKPTPAIVRKFEKAIQTKSKKTLLTGLLHDEQNTQLERYVRQKLSHHKDVVASETAAKEPSEAAEATDIMAVLKKSLQERAA